jgi:putative transposase
MARQARKVSPTSYYHVMMRGNNREKIFTREEQKLFFIQLLKNLTKENAIEIAAYCLMENHVHIVVNGEITDLSAAIKKINIKYAAKFNKETDRIGHVFQDRYKSEVVLNEAHLLQVVRYVHNNPVKSKRIKNPEDYRWSSYKEYINSIFNIINQKQRNIVMGFFSNKLDLLKKFHQELDYGDYLDIKEDIQHCRKENAQLIISDFYLSKGITGIEEIIKDTGYLKEIIRKLLAETKLSHRQIASHLNISNNIVHKVSLEK